MTEDGDGPSPVTPDKGLVFSKREYAAIRLVSRVRRSLEVHCEGGGGDLRQGALLVLTRRGRTRAASPPAIGQSSRGVIGRACPEGVLSCTSIGCSTTHRAM